jgi:hypothetical protein
MAENPPNVAIEAAQEKSLGAFTARKAFFDLYEAAAPHLSKAQLELMARATTQAQLEADYLSDVLETLGLLIADDEEDAWDIKSRCPQLLWQASHQLDYISALIALGTSAEYRLKHLSHTVESMGGGSHPA